MEKLNLLSVLASEDISVTRGQWVYTSKYTGKCLYCHLCVGFTGMNHAFDVASLLQ
jgi:hypothetical protein